MLGEDVIDLRLDGRIAHKEARRDLRVAVTLGDQPHHLQFARR
jgi:hypothetical protein